MREPRSGDKEKLFYLAASRLVFAASRLSHAEKNQEKPLGPGYSFRRSTEQYRRARPKGLGTNIPNME